MAFANSRKPAAVKLPADDTSEPGVFRDAQGTWRSIGVAMKTYAIPQNRIYAAADHPSPLLGGKILRHKAIPRDQLGVTGRRKDVLVFHDGDLQDMATAYRRPNPGNLENRPKEQEAINVLIAYTRQHDRCPRHAEVAAELGISSLQTPKQWPAYHQRYKRAARRFGVAGFKTKRSKRAKAREAIAIGFQEKYAKEVGRVPLLAVVASAVDIKYSSLYEYPKFVVARRLLEARFGRNAPCASHKRTGEKNAIQLLRELVQATGELPLQKEIAKLVGVKSCTLQKWKSYQKARRVEAARLGVPLVGGRKTDKEAKAIALLEEAARNGDDPPTKKQLAHALGVHIDTPRSWPRFQRAYKRAQAPFLTRTRWGKPVHWREGQAVAKLLKETEATGRVPSIDDFAAGLDCDPMAFRLWPVFRAAYRAIAANEAGPHRGNGELAAGGDQVAETPADTSTAAGKRKKTRKGRGPYKTPNDRAAERKLWDDWQAAKAAGTCTIAEFARNRGLKLRDVSSALERERKRRRRTARPDNSEGRQ